MLGEPRKNGKKFQPRMDANEHELLVLRSSRREEAQTQRAVSPKENTAPTTSKPARLRPNVRPPHPEKTSMALGFFTLPDSWQMRRLCRARSAALSGLGIILGNVTQGGSRVAALPWAIFFRAFSPDS
jgi:hypothetical protein